MVSIRVLCCWGAVLVFTTKGGAGPSFAEDPASPQLKVATPVSPADSVKLTGFSRAAQTELSGLKSGSSKWANLLSVYVAEQKSERPLPVLGTHSFLEGDVSFSPQFPWQRGVKYRVRVNPGTLSNSKTAPQEMTFTLKKLPTGPPTELVQIYPTAGKLPENLLKFYLHFSAPMTQGDSYRFLHLYNEQGKEVELPFLELGEELWDQTGTRLTVFFDPGRIKRGLKPRMEEGPILIEGKRFRFVVEAGWEDAQGRPLKKQTERWIDTLAPDAVQPDHRNWQVTVPPAGTRQPLRLTFPESLDHAMLQRVLVLNDPQGKEVTGTIAISKQETVWELTPDRNWKPGDYTLRVAAVLEDVAGNSIGRPFEVDVIRPTTRSISQETVQRVITILESR